MKKKKKTGVAVVCVLFIQTVSMGNCCSDVSSGAGAIAGVGGTAAISSARGTTNDAVDYYLKSRGFNGLFSHIEVPSLHHFISSFCFYLRVS